MAVVASLGLGQPLGVRVVRVEGLRAVATCRDGRLLDVDLLAVDVRRGDDQRRARADWRDSASIGRSAAPQHEHVVAGYLRVVGRYDTRVSTLIVVARILPV